MSRQLRIFARMLARILAAFAGPRLPRRRRIGAYSKRAASECAFACICFALAGSARPRHKAGLLPAGFPVIRVPQGSPMAKIQVRNPVVEMDGDEMTRIIWQL